MLTSDIVPNDARRAVIVTADEAFQTDKEGKRAKNPEEEQTNEDMAATRPGQPEADSSAVRFKTFAMPVNYTDCSACGEDMMQGQLKCQRCGHGTKESNDVQLFRAGLQQLSNFPCWGAFILWRLWKLRELRANLVFVGPGARSEVHTSNKGGFVSRLPGDLAGHCLELFVEQE